MKRRVGLMVINTLRVDSDGDHKLRQTASGLIAINSGRLMLWLNRQHQGVASIR